ncbi:DUF6087 family protein [Kitasatospora sp. NPDC001309]|uniref:DUF6087 family protein n=1 Tax=Kitasatospora sp. NPDC001309 TaxID=3364013 RepID=UPI0036B7A09E
MDSEEPLERWAERRDRRLRPVGQLKAVIIGHEDRSSHLHPDLPRVLLRWDGYQWLPESYAENFAAAQRLLHGISGDGVIQGTSPPPRKKSAGRHRRPA